MSESTSKRVANNLCRELYTLEDESNPRSSQVDTIWPSTILDQVFDNLSPTNKTLRQILEDLKQEIITGGRGNIVFPVTSVNGKVDDIVITKEDVGLGNVDNTSDIDKPLSIPQRTAVEEMLATYNFQVNLEDLYNHLMDTANPHDVTIEQLNKDENLATFVRRYIGMHNLSRENTVHPDIRSSLTRLWVLVDDQKKSIEERLGSMLRILNGHYDNPLAHQELFMTKEDVANKVPVFSFTENNDHAKYPSTRAVIEYIGSRLDEFRRTLPDVQDWIDDIIIVDRRSQVPTASARYHRKAYIIRNGNGSHDELAICRKNPNGTYSWDYSTMGTYSKFNKDHFVDTPDGLSVNMQGLVNYILSKNGPLDMSLAEVLKDYYTSQEIDDMNFVHKISILPGTVDGTIRFYVNDKMETMSDDIKVAGLQRLAYLEFVTEEELKDQSVYGRHIVSKSIEPRHLADGFNWGVESMRCRYGYVIGNIRNATGTKAHEIPLMQLADSLRPLIGGWPDPDVPGGNPWSEALFESIMHPQTMQVGIEYDFKDRSYGMRFVGEISSIENVDVKTILTDKITLGPYRMIDAGGTWQYQTDPDEWTILGGSNITGHTFATVNMTKNGLELETISIGKRMNAQYDIWVKYVKSDEIDRYMAGKM